MLKNSMIGKLIFMLKNSMIGKLISIFNFYFSKFFLFYFMFLQANLRLKITI
jgi:hypothetical protein